MTTIDKEYLAKILIKKLKEVKEFEEIISIVKNNTKGKIYLIGGAVSRTLARELYGGAESINDFDFVVDELNIELKIGEDWKVSYHKFGNPCLKRDDIEIDIFPLSDHEYIKNNKLKPTIENMIKGVPFTIQTLAFDIKEEKLIGEEGIKALKNRKFQVNNEESAKNVAKRKGLSINERMLQKAKTMDFGIIPYE